MSRNKPNVDFKKTIEGVRMILTTDKGQKFMSDIKKREKDWDWYDQWVFTRTTKDSPL
jgi:hypothetical protein